MEALALKAAKLSFVDIIRPLDALGKTTETQIQTCMRTQLIQMAHITNLIKTHLVSRILVLSMRLNLT